MQRVPPPAGKRGNARARHRLQPQPGTALVRRTLIAGMRITQKLHKL
jgi:hypothetical protein